MIRDDSTMADETDGLTGHDPIDVLLVLLGLAALLLLVHMATGAAAAQPNNSTSLDDAAPYYNNSTTANATPPLDVWLAGASEPTLQTMLDLAIRSTTFWLGTGTAPGGGPAGVLLTTLLVGGAVLAMVRGSRIGLVAGGVVGLSAVGLMVTMGLAPRWLFAIALLLVGLVAAGVFARVVR
jgi:hypothetical protein